MSLQRTAIPDRVVKWDLSYTKSHHTAWSALIGWKGLRATDGHGVCAE